jgi:hypothetical protein
VEGGDWEGRVEGDPSWDERSGFDWRAEQEAVERGRGRSGELGRLSAGGPINVHRFGKPRCRLSGHGGSISPVSNQRFHLLHGRAVETSVTFLFLCSFGDGWTFWSWFHIAIDTVTNLPVGALAILQTQIEVGSDP